MGRFFKEQLNNACGALGTGSLKNNYQLFFKFSAGMTGMCGLNTDYSGMFRISNTSL